MRGGVGVVALGGAFPGFQWGCATEQILVAMAAMLVFGKIERIFRAQGGRRVGERVLEAGWGRLAQRIVERIDVERVVAVSAAGAGEGIRAGGGEVAGAEWGWRIALRDLGHR